MKDETEEHFRGMLRVDTFLGQGVIIKQSTIGTASYN